MNRLILLASCLLLPALTEPDPIDGGDPRYRTVEWRQGAVIRLIAARGQTLMVTMPQGWEVFSVMVSDQDVMKNIIVEELRGMNERPAGTERPSAEPRPNNGCAVTANMQVCVQRDRYIFFKPLTPLDPQPVPVIMLQSRSNAEPIEREVLFEIEAPDEPSSRQAGPPQPSGHYYSVRVTLPPVAQRSAVAAPVRRQRPVIAESRAVVAPPINNQYRVEGDRSLLGESGR